MVAIFFHNPSGKRVIVGARTQSFHAAARVPPTVNAPETDSNVPLNERAKRMITPCAARNAARRPIERETSNGKSPSEQGSLPRRQTSSKQAVVAQRGELL